MRQNNFITLITFISIINLLKNSLLKDNHTKNGAANGINIENNHDYLKFFFDNFLENFRFDQFTNSEVLLKEYII
jgi:hypothetical protein